MIPDRPALRQLVEHWSKCAIFASSGGSVVYEQCAAQLEAALEALPLQSEVLTAQRERDEAIRQHGHAVAAVDHAVTAIQTVVNVIGGTVEGAPTHRGNYLQRLRELLQTEARIKEMEAALPLPSADPPQPQKVCSHQYWDLGRCIDCFKTQDQIDEEKRADMPPPVSEPSADLRRLREAAGYVVREFTRWSNNNNVALDDDVLDALSDLCDAEAALLTDAPAARTEATPPADRRATVRDLRGGTTERVHGFIQSYCDAHGYPGGLRAIPLMAVLELLTVLAADHTEATPRTATDDFPEPFQGILRRFDDLEARIKAEATPPAERLRELQEALDAFDTGTERYAKLLDLKLADAVRAYLRAALREAETPARKFTFDDYCEPCITATWCSLHGGCLAEKNPSEKDT